MFALEELKQLVDTLPYEFRLLGGDGEIYYSGRCADIAEAGDYQAFAPLDWAETDSDCTCLEYREAGKGSWIPL